MTHYIQSGNYDILKELITEYDIEYDKNNILAKTAVEYNQKSILILLKSLNIQKKLNKYNERRIFRNRMKNSLNTVSRDLIFRQFIDSRNFEAIEVFIEVYDIKSLFFYAVATFNYIPYNNKNIQVFEYLSFNDINHEYFFSEINNSVDILAFLLDNGEEDMINLQNERTGQTVIYTAIKDCNYYIL